MLHGDQRDLVDLSFRIPSECAHEVASGAADIGIIPSVELNRNNYGRVRGLGIASRGAVRSILLISSKPFRDIQTLAGDISSRTSVALARIILGRKYGTEPKIVPHAPDLTSMLAVADAALIIGDPALHLDPPATRAGFRPRGHNEQIVGPWAVTLVQQAAAIRRENRFARPGVTGGERARRVGGWFPFLAHQTGRAQLEHPAFRLVSPQRPRKCSDKTAPCDGTPDTSFALRQKLDWEHSELQRLSDFRQ